MKGQLLLIQRLSYSFVLSIILAACSSAPPPPIMTNEKFDSRQMNSGNIEFVYGISWRHTSKESLAGQQPEAKPAKKGGRTKDKKRAFQFSPKANNQTKLELEDKAAEALKQKLQKEQLCLTGYKINKVIWKADNIRLFGECNHSKN